MSEGVTAHEAGTAQPDERRLEHLYVHVPFCRSRCAYCDFHALTIDDGAADPRVRRFIDRAVEVVEGQVERGVVRPLETGYLGGGTPTALGAGLAELVERILRATGVSPGAEITVEVNPESADASSLESLARCGVTRVSLGAQSFDDEVLRTLGRRHDASAAVRALRDAQEVGLEVSGDLMCGVPGQTMASWESTLETAVGLGLEHLSVYPLALEEGTPLYRSVDAGHAPAPDEDVAASMLELAEAELQAAGLARYEISNYAAEGHESRHNTAYWVGAPYLGVGPSAASMCGPATAERVDPALRCGSDAERVRFAVAEGLDAFAEGTVGALRQVECMSQREAALEDAVLGLRLAMGVGERQADAVGASGVLEEMEQRGLVTRSDGRWRLDGRGWLLANEVFGAVWGLG